MDGHKRKNEKDLMMNKDFLNFSCLVDNTKESQKNRENLEIDLLKNGILSTGKYGKRRQTVIHNDKTTTFYRINKNYST